MMNTDRKELIAQAEQAITDLRNSYGRWGLGVADIIQQLVDVVDVAPVATDGEDAFMRRMMAKRDKLLELTTSSQALFNDYDALLQFATGQRDALVAVSAQLRDKVKELDELKREKSCR